MLPKDELLKGIENRDEVARVLDLAEQSLRTWEISQTDFLSPPVLLESQRSLGKLTELTAIAWGGYPQAERQRLAIVRAEIPCDRDRLELAVLDIAGNFLFDPASHRDFMGSILGTGIVRDKVGDIIVLGERGAQVIVVPEIALFLESALLQVRSVPVKTRPIDPSELRVSPPQRKAMTTVEASLRLDAIASAGFGISRSKMADAIHSGDVRVNWKEITQASHGVQAGDLISFRGKGRLEIGEIAITKKQRYRVELARIK